MSSLNRSGFLLFAALASCNSAPDGFGKTATVPAPTDPATSEGADAMDPVATAAPKNASREVAPGVFSFEGTDAALPFEDLAPLAGMVEGAKYIGVGESIHTSGGYLAFKNRFIRYLVQEKGVRVFAMETPRTNAAQVEHYIQTCDGTPKMALRGIFGVFADENTAALVEWLCRFNRQHQADPVHFFGFDAQQPDDDYAELSQFFATAPPEESSRLFAGLSTCQARAATAFDPTTGAPKPFPDSDYDACAAGLDALDRYLADHRASLIEAQSNERVVLAELASISFRSWQTQLWSFESDPATSYEVRDLAMHGIFARLRDLYYADARMVIWAHNYHLMKSHPAVVGDGVDGARTFGGELFREVGDAYAPIGLIASRVEINWGRVGNGPRPAPAADALETKLESFQKPFLFLDARSPWLGADQDYPLGGREGGSMIPAEQFSALVYLAHSPKMKALYW